MTLHKHSPSELEADACCTVLEVAKFKRSKAEREKKKHNLSCLTFFFLSPLLLDYYSK